MADKTGAVPTAAARRLAASLERVFAPLAGTATVTFAEARPREALAGLPGPLLAMRFELNKGLSGAGALLVPGAAALRLARMLLAEDPAEVPDAPGEAERDGFGELANQVAGTVATALGALAGVAVGFEASNAEWLPGGGGAFQVPADGQALAVDLRAGMVEAEAILVVPAAAFAAAAPAAPPRAAAPPAALPSLPEPPAPRNGNGGIEMLLDVSLPVSVELGRTRMMIRDILHLAPGSILELDKLAGDPVEILINGKSIARGEVVVIDENFGVRLTSIVTPSERVNNLR